MSKLRRRVAAAAAASGLLLLSTLTACSGGGGGMDFSGGSSSSAPDVLVVNQRSVALVLNDENVMCNDALRLTVTGMQRRPMSTFQGYSLEGENSTGSVGTDSNDDIVIQVDLKFEWNINTYNSNTGGASAPSTLGEIMRLGKLLYIQGEDANGERYLAAETISADTTSSSSGASENLQLGSQWDYNVLNAKLPETSKTAQGSILFKVASTASDLKMYLISPDGGQDITGGDIMSGNVTLYTLDLT